MFCFDTAPRLRAETPNDRGVLLKPAGPRQSRDFGLHQHVIDGNKTTLPHALVRHGQWTTWSPNRNPSTPSTDLVAVSRYYTLDILYHLRMICI